jgi:ribosomal protein S18 acetylase RimI-like enzyme
MHVERLGLGEWRRLRDLRLRALRDAPDAFSATIDEALSRSPESWSKQLDMPTFVAVSGAVDVGMVRCAPDEHRSDTGWLISMWVASDVRRTGVGAALVDVIIDHARAHGITRLLLDVADDNAPAIALYTRKGFAPTGEKGTLPPPRQQIGEHRRELRLPI